jgi:hypothetical protein
MIVRIDSDRNGEVFAESIDIFQTAVEFSFAVQIAVGKIEHCRNKILFLKKRMSGTPRPAGSAAAVQEQIFHRSSFH